MDYEIYQEFLSDTFCSFKHPDFSIEPISEEKFAEKKLSIRTNFYKMKNILEIFNEYLLLEF